MYSLSSLLRRDPHTFMYNIHKKCIFSLLHIRSSPTSCKNCKIGYCVLVNFVSLVPYQCLAYYSQLNINKEGVLFTQQIECLLCARHYSRNSKYGNKYKRQKSLPDGVNFLTC